MLSAASAIPSASEQQHALLLASFPVQLTQSLACQASTSSVAHASRTPIHTIQNQFSIEELTAQCAKALKEDRKDALSELERYEREPITLNAGERVTDLVRFWKRMEKVYP